MKINPSALRHGTSEDEILYALAHRAYEAEPDDDIPAKQFVMGLDTHGRLLELAIVTFDSGHQLVIHAMKARGHLRHLMD